MLKEGNNKKIVILTTFATFVYIGFEFYIGMLAIFFTLKWVIALLFTGMVLINMIGLKIYDFFGEDLLSLEKGKKWIEDDGDRRFYLVKYALRKIKWLTFLVLSVFPCPLAGYLYIQEKDKETFLTSFLMICIGSVPCTLIWGCGARATWLLISSQNKWLMVIVFISFVCFIWIYKKTKPSKISKGGLYGNNS